MNKQQRKIIYFILVLSLIISVLSGCDKLFEKKGTNGADGTKNEGTKKGRYMERDMALPKGIKKDEIVDVIEGKDKTIELFTLNREKETYGHYIKEGKGWKRVPLKWLNEKKLYRDSSMYVEQFFYGEDGNYYIRVIDYKKKERYIIYKINEKKNMLEEKTLAYLQEPLRVNDNGEDVYPYVTKMEALKNGNFVIAEDSDMVIVDGKKGEKIKTLSVDDISNLSSYYADGNEVIAVSNKKNEISFINGTSGEVTKTAAIEEGVSKCHFYVKEDKTLLQVNSSGIQQLKENGSMWETIVDGALNSMSMPSFSISEFFVLEGKRDSYLVVYSDKYGFLQFMQYEYDESVMAVPQEEITIYSLEENASIRQAVSEFHRKNSNAKITYIVSMSEKGEKKEDYIRALNTELLNGSGADILVLDGLPVSSYIDKGVLYDLKELYSGLAKENNIPDYISKAYETDNKLYSLPCRFTVPVIYGREKAVKAWSGIENILSYLEKDRDKAYINGLSKEQLLHIFLSEGGEKLFTKENQLKVDTFKTYLENIKQVSEKFNTDDEDEIKERKEKMERVTGKEKLYKNYGVSSYLDDLSETEMEQIGSIEDSMEFLAFINQKKDFYNVVNNLFIPSGAVGINKASKNKELSKEFLKILFSDEVQRVDVNDGFPVNEKSLKAWFNKKGIPYTMALSSEKGTRFEISWPNKETRQTLFDKIQAAQNRFQVNETMLQILTTEAMKYLEGTASLEEVSNSAKSKVDTYLAE